VEALAAGTGPIAVDAERASGFRYGQDAYLIQLRRAGSGTVLIDPLATGPLDSLARVLDGPEWILHAADQDLPCLTTISSDRINLVEQVNSPGFLGYINNAA